MDSGDIYASASFLLAESLAKMGSSHVSIGKLNPLLSRCPRLPSENEKNSEFQVKRFNRDFHVRY